MGLTVSTRYQECYLAWSLRITCWNTKGRRTLMWLLRCQVKYWEMQLSFLWMWTWTWHHIWTKYSLLRGLEGAWGRGPEREGTRSQTSLQSLHLPRSEALCSTRHNTFNSKRHCSHYFLSQGPWQDASGLCLQSQEVQLKHLLILLHWKSPGISFRNEDSIGFSLPV